MQWRRISGTEVEASKCGKIRINGTIVKTIISQNYPNTPAYERCTRLRAFIGTDRVHIAVALAWIPNPNKHPIVLHGKDGSTVNHISNLRWGTYSENNREKFLNGESLPDPASLDDVKLIAHRIHAQGLNNIKAVEGTKLSVKFASSLRNGHRHKAILRQLGYMSQIIKAKQTPQTEWGGLFG